jgi:hypothetical protein
MLGSLHLNIGMIYCLVYGNNNHSTNDDLVVIPKKELDALIERADSVVTEDDILRRAREARRLGKAGKLPPLSALRKA